MPIKETWLYISPDGVSYPLDVDGKRSVLSYEGTGMPEIKYITQRGAYQHGVTVNSFRLEPRIIQLIIRHNFCNRDDFWSGRLSLLNSIRPNRASILSPGILRKIRSDSSKRDLDVYIQEGPKFSPKELGVWDEWGFTEVLRFLAPNPIPYDPTIHSALFFSGYSARDLVLPFDIPFVLGVDTFYMSSDITYLGTWPEYPTIIITGRIENPVILNNTTGEKLALEVFIDFGETVVIDLKYGYKTIMMNGSTNYIKYLTPDSDLEKFHIEPAPVAVGGVNNITVSGYNSSLGAGFEIQYYTREIGY